MSKPAWLTKQKGAQGSGSRLLFFFLIPSDLRIHRSTPASTPSARVSRKLTDACPNKIEEGWITVYRDLNPMDSLRLFVSPLTGETITLHGRERLLAGFSDDPPVG